MNPTVASLPARVPITERIEWGLLIGLAFVLPLFEAPKNILWLAFIGLWIANRWRSRDFGGRWDYWDTLIVLWIASGYASAAFAGIHDDEWSAAADIVRYASVLWVLKRSRYPDGTWVGMIAAIFAGTLVGLLWGYWTLYVTKTDLFLALNSVGHVNHSAIYLATVCGLGIASVQAGWKGGNALSRTAGLALFALLIVSLFWMQSRAAVGAAFIMVVALHTSYAARRRRRFGLVALATAGAVAALLLLSPLIVEKNRRFIEYGDTLNGRGQIWRLGLAAWREFPLFGVGMGNYGRVDYERLESWRARRGEALDRQSFHPAAHGHSLYINTLAERGLAGLGVLLAVLAAWAFALVRRIPDSTAPPLVWTLWGSAAGAWIITVAVGVLNTPLHHEEALLCMLLLGGWLSIRQTMSDRRSGL